MWVIMEKLIDNPKTIKARLVARGFQEEHDFVVESPTAHKSTLRIAFTMAAMKSWKIKTTYIKSAFLQGQNIERDLLLGLPKESDDEYKLRNLNKAAYKLNDATQQWYVSVKEVIESLGWIQSKFDPALFQYYSDNKLEGFLPIHGDIIHIGSDRFSKSINEPLQKPF